MSDRLSWDEYFMGIAIAASARSDCEKSKVGAVVVKDRRVRATGYNGAPAGKSGCSTCPRRTSGAAPNAGSYEEGATRCVAVHAEANALLYCDRADLHGATLYVTRDVCPGCRKLIEAAGVARVVWRVLSHFRSKPDKGEVTPIYEMRNEGVGEFSYVEQFENNHNLEKFPLRVIDIPEIPKVETFKLPVYPVTQEVIDDSVPFRDYIASQIRNWETVR